MNIEHWPIGRIMQLPDCAFGRRFVISMTVFAETGGTAWDISEIALPERCVIWEMTSQTHTTLINVDSFRLALGQVKPATVAEFNELEPLINGLGKPGPEPRQIIHNGYTTLQIRHLKMNIESKGQKTVLEMTAIDATSAMLMIMMVISGVPREVPDWMISGPVKDLL